MVFDSVSVQLKNGQSAIIRNAEPKDAKTLIQYLKITAAETLFLRRNSEEISITLEKEMDFINRQKDAKRDLLLIAEIDGNHAGNVSCTSFGEYQRYFHRCSIAIALYQKYCGLGLGKIMLNIVLEKAKEVGYEQAELEVVTTNGNAISLYKQLGFEIYGTQRHSMKYSDGTYADEYLMMKRLK